MSRLPLAALVAWLASGCVIGAPEPVLCPTTQAIVNGMSEPGHPAVVALLDREGRVTCTGTIIDQRDTLAFVLTATHCASSALLVTGQPEASAPPFPILFVARSASADLSLLAVRVPERPLARIAVLEPAEDRLGEGDPVLIVGYGQSTARSRTGDPSGNPSRDRRSIWARISHLDDGAFSYGQACGGPCAGDSGGPALVRRDGGWRLAGITSRGDPTCRVEGESVRVSPHTRFIAEVLDRSTSVIALAQKSSGPEK